MNDPRLVIAARVIVAVTWIYQGIWLKIIARDPEFLAFIENLGLPNPGITLTIIGICEGLLGLAVLSGAYPKALAKLQIVLILATGFLAAFSSTAAAGNTFGVFLSNAPLLLCIVITGWRRTSPTWSRFA